MQLALNFLDWYQTVFLAILQLVNTGIICFCMEMLAFGSNAILATWKEDVMGGSISLRLSRGSGRGVSPFHLSPGCIRGAGLIFILWLSLFLLVCSLAFWVFCTAFALGQKGFFTTTDV